MCQYRRFSCLNYQLCVCVACDTLYCNVCMLFKKNYDHFNLSCVEIMIKTTCLDSNVRQAHIQSRPPHPYMGRQWLSWRQSRCSCCRGYNRVRFFLRGRGGLAELLGVSLWTWCAPERSGPVAATEKRSSLHLVGTAANTTLL